VRQQHAPVYATKSAPPSGLTIRLCRLLQRARRGSGGRRGTTLALDAVASLRFGCQLARGRVGGHRRMSQGTATRYGFGVIPVPVRVV
jgi:hypothetical protein